VSANILAAVMGAPRQPIVVREFPRPDLPPGSAPLKTASFEVCGTDVHLWHGRLCGVPYPIIPGPRLRWRARSGARRRGSRGAVEMSFQLPAPSCQVGSPSRQFSSWKLSNWTLEAGSSKLFRWKLEAGSWKL
jgi:hypothetical protein